MAFSRDQGESIPSGSGQIFDLDTAKLREEFRVKRPPIKQYEGHGYRLQYSDDSQTLAINDNGNVAYMGLWDTNPLAPRVEMDAKALGTSRIGGFDGYNIAFLRDNRWLLTVKEAPPEERQRFTGGLLQFRDAQSGELRKELSFPKELGQFDLIEKQPDGRVMTRFVSRKKSQERVMRHFLWNDEDLLRYAAEHGSAPMPKPKAK